MLEEEATEEEDDCSSFQCLLVGAFIELALAASHVFIRAVSDGDGIYMAAHVCVVMCQAVVGVTMHMVAKEEQRLERQRLETLRCREELMKRLYPVTMQTLENLAAAAVARSVHSGADLGQLGLPPGLLCTVAYARVVNASRLRAVNIRMRSARAVCFV